MRFTQSRTAAVWYPVRFIALSDSSTLSGMRGLPLPGGSNRPSGALERIATDTWLSR